MQMRVRNYLHIIQHGKCKIPWLELEWWADNKPWFPHLPGNTLNLKTDIGNFFKMSLRKLRLVSYLSE